MSSTPRCANFATALALLLAGCGQPPPGPHLSRAAERGRNVYDDNCASCHNPRDPHLDGSQGPPVAGASRQLLEAKVLNGRYPPGYRPIRGTFTMPRQPWLTARMADLHAFLAEVPATH